MTRLAGTVHFGRAAETPSWFVNAADGDARVAHDDEAGLRAAFDGHLDNRDELAAVLRTQAGATDARLVLQAFHRWGPDCPGRLLGDFAFVVWDERRRVLFGARDPLGVRPFYYRAERNAFHWASDLSPLVASDGGTRSPNEGMIAEYLSGVITSQVDTLYQAVSRLPRAHTIVVTGDGVRTGRYWAPDPERRERWATDGEYEEQFLSLFREAVRCRLRGPAPVGVMLSGGLDSSCVTGMACELARTTPGVAGIEAFSLVFPGRSCDEAPFIRNVADLHGVTTHVMAENYPGDWLHDAEESADIPDYPTGAMSAPLRARARARGIRVMLTGLGGDEWFGGSGHRHADALRRGHLRALVRGLRAEAALPGFEGWRPAIKHAVWPLVPEGLKQRVRRRLRRPVWPPWIAPDFARRVSLADRLDALKADVSFPTLAQRGLYSETLSGWSIHTLEILDRTTASAGLDVRHPFHDRRLVEFAIALPEDQRWRPRETKSIVRRAARGLVPPSTAGRLSSPDYSHVFVEALERAGGAAAFSNLAIAREGWVREEELRSAWQRTAHAYQRGDAAFSVGVWRLWLAYAIETWWRASSARREWRQHDGSNAIGF